MDRNEIVVHEVVAHALLRAATALVPLQGIRKRSTAMRSLECERGTQKCVRHARSCVRHSCL